MPLRERVKVFFHIAGSISLQSTVNVDIPVRPNSTALLKRCTGEGTKPKGPVSYSPY